MSSILIVDMLAPIQSATTIAVQTFSEVYPSAEDVRLEEFVIADDDQSCEVTISGLVPASKDPNALNQLAQILKTSERIYRTFRFNRYGKLKGMSIRSVNE